MALTLYYGTYAFPAGGAVTRTSTVLNKNKAGIPYSLTHKMECEAHIPGDGQTAITTALSNLTAALKVPFKDLVFKDDQNADTVLRLRNAGSIGGVLITEGPNYPEYRGQNYATEMKITFTAEAEYPLAGTLKMMLDFQEHLDFSGGGPVRIYKPAVGDVLPQLQQPYDHTPFTLMQSGKAEGYRAYPKPLPIWPKLLMETGEIGMDTPQRRGLVQYQSYVTTWRYKMQSAKVIIAVPTLWTG